MEQIVRLAVVAILKSLDFSCQALVCFRKYSLCELLGFQAYSSVAMYSLMLLLPCVPSVLDSVHELKYAAATDMAEVLVSESGLAIPFITVL